MAVKRTIALPRVVLINTHATDPALLAVMGAANIFQDFTADTVSGSDPAMTRIARCESEIRTRDCSHEV